jgi:hypothetical protein
MLSPQWEGSRFLTADGPDMLALNAGGGEEGMILLSVRGAVSLAGDHILRLGWREFQARPFRVVRAQIVCVFEDPLGPALRLRLQSLNRNGGRLEPDHSRAERHELEEEIVPSYLHEAHLYHWLGSDGHGRVPNS